MPNPQNNIERLHTGPAGEEKVEKKQDESHAREVREASREFIEGVSEVVEGVETGEVAEKTGEDKKKGPQGRFPTTTGQQVKAQLKSLIIPRIEVMQIQIATAINKEIAFYAKEAERVSDKPFELNNVISKIRELRDILSSLTQVTFETLKNWWLKFVNRS